MHPATEAILRWFSYEHLTRTDLRIVSAKFHQLAHELAEDFEGAELTVALRKLLEAKDAAVRAALG